MNRTLAFVALVSLAACKDPPKTETTSAAASATPKAADAGAVEGAPSATPALAAPSDGGANLADVDGVLTVAWKVANAASENVTVSLVAGEKTLPVGPLNAASDDAPGTVATCAMKNKGATTSELSCGGTPAYNFYTASIKGGALVVTLTTGVDGDPASEKVKEVARHPTAATSLKATGPASKALYGNCRAGQVQRTADSPCLHQCLKGTECKGKDTCQMIAVTGTDGPHRVHACVPPGK